MTAAEDWPEVTEHLRAKDGENTISTRSMSLQDLKTVPFEVFVHRQRKGDLVVLPPRRLGHPRLSHQPTNDPPSFSQTIHRGITASLCWERMTLRALETFIYHDMIFKQRYGDCRLAICKLTLRSICAQIRYHPHQILCSAVLKLHEELTNLKKSQPNDPAILSAKSGALERGCKLLDEVIDSCYRSQDDLPSIELTPPPPCSFCGGELFQTAFRCTDSCVRDDADSGSVDPKILICNLCFADGRACRCESMTPYQLQPLAGLIGLRMNVANLLDLTDEGGPPWS